MRRMQSVLLVEDEPLSRKFMAKMLKDNGYFVLEASQGKAALELALHHRGPIHVLITDIILTGPLDGMELGVELRRQRPDLRVLYVSGYPSDTAERLGLEAYSDNFISKPFTARQFLSQLVECLANRHSMARRGLARA